LGHRSRHLDVGEAAKVSGEVAAAKEIFIGEVAVDEREERPQTFLKKKKGGPERGREGRKSVVLTAWQKGKKGRLFVVKSKGKKE